MKARHACGLAGVWCACMIAALRADTLVLKDGRRVDGDLIAVDDGVIEFDGRRGQGGRERLTIDRVDVSRIELEESLGAQNARTTTTPSSRPAGMRERDVTVDATVRWNDTGIDVGAGQTLYFAATDRIRWGPGRRDGPDGEHNSPNNPARPMPNQRAGALIGRIGESRDSFIIGSDRGPIRMRSSGRLFLSVNDDQLQDNAGSFRVKVFY